MPLHWMTKGNRLKSYGGLADYDIYNTDYKGKRVYYAKAFTEYSEFYETQLEAMIWCNNYEKVLRGL